MAELVVAVENEGIMPDSLATLHLDSNWWGLILRAYATISLRLCISLNKGIDGERERREGNERERVRERESKRGRKGRNGVRVRVRDGKGGREKMGGRKRRKRWRKGKS